MLTVRVEHMCMVEVYRGLVSRETDRHKRDTFAKDEERKSKERRENTLSTHLAAIDEYV